MTTNLAPVGMGMAGCGNVDVACHTVLECLGLGGGCRSNAACIRALAQGLNPAGLTP